MKRFLCFAVAASMLLSLSSCGSAPTDTESAREAESMEALSSSSSVEKSAQAAQEEGAIENNPVPPEEATQEPADDAQLSPSGELGEYEVDITSCEIVNDVSGNLAALVTYTFKNNSAGDKNAAASIAVRSYQNGVELATSVVMDIEADNSLKELKTGASIEVQQAYALLSETAPIEIEAEELISLSGEKLGATVDIAEGGETVLNVAPEGQVSGSLGEFTVSIVEAATGEDYSGAPMALFTLGFTNNGNKEATFIGSISCKAFQDGVELEKAIVSDASLHVADSQIRNIKPGAGIPVYVAFVLSNTSSPVIVEAEKLISINGDAVTMTFTFD